VTISIKVEWGWGGDVFGCGLLVGGFVVGFVDIVEGRGEGRVDRGVGKGVASEEPRRSSSGSL